MPFPMIRHCGKIIGFQDLGFFAEIRIFYKFAVKYKMKTMTNGKMRMPGASASPRRTFANHIPLRSFPEAQYNPGVRTGVVLKLLCAF
jgi:hypothetical protein